MILSFHRTRPRAFFIVILVSSSLAITGFSVYTIYKTAIESLQTTLTDIVRRQATIVHVLKKQEKSDAEIISFFREMRKEYYNLGKKGEVVIAWRSEDSIKFLISSKPMETIVIPFSGSEPTLPMKLAISGDNGFIKSRDYLGEKVYAAYIYIPETRWGMVAKIPSHEVDNPYIKTAVIAFIVSVVLISLCGFSYTKVTNPLLKKTMESEEKFRSLFDNITEGFAIHELIYENDQPVDYRILSVNPAFFDHTGIASETVIGKLATEAYKTAEPPFLKEYVDVATTGKPYRFSTFFASINKHFVISVVSTKAGQFATLFNDITEELKNQKELKLRNEELTRFIYTMSHDLKTPLVTIKAFLAFLIEDFKNRDKEAQDRDIKYINNAVDKMSVLLHELLELSRIGRKEESKSETSLKTLAQEAIDLVAGPINQKKVKIQFTGKDVLLFGFRQRFVQLYQNLIDNAVKFMGNQPDPLIEIGSFFDPDKNEVILFVRDNGTGIDPEYHHKVFGLFEKLDTGTDGTGIGLALIKRIVEVHNGSIWFTSEGNGKGTTFYFTLEGTRVNK